MRARQQRHRDRSGPAALLLFGIFAVCILSVLLTGAGTYRRLTERDSRNFDSRTAASYLLTRVRGQEEKDKIFAADFEDPTPKSEGDTLYFEQEIGGYTLYTRIYCCDGYMRELFSYEDGEFLPEDGEMLMKAEGVSFAMEDGLLRIELTQSDGSKEYLTTTLRSGRRMP